MSVVRVKALMFEPQLRELGEELAKLSDFEVLTLQVTYCSPVGEQLASNMVKKVRLLAALAGNALKDGDPVVITQEAREDQSRKSWDGNPKLQIRLQADRRIPTSNALVLARDGSITFISPTA